MRTLSLTIWHQEKLGKNVFLGEVMQNLNELLDGGKLDGTPTPEWFDLQEKVCSVVYSIYCTPFLKSFL